MRSTPNYARASRPFDYDVCLSFARENRSYVRKVAMALRKSGVRVFFDEYATVDMWGKDLFTQLDDLYQNKARYCVIFVSRAYAQRVWTNHERQSAQARAIRQHGEYILPARFDMTPLPGLRSTVGYVDLRTTTAQELASLVTKKLGDSPRHDYFPPVPDRLFDFLKAKGATPRYRVESRARGFFDALRRMTPEERRAVIMVFVQGCPGELPKNVHVSLDLLRRLTGYPTSRLCRLLSGLGSLGLRMRIRKGRRSGSGGHSGELVVLDWDDASTDEMVFGNATCEAAAMIGIVSRAYCEEHGMDTLLRLDFSCLSSATYTKAGCH